MQIVTQNTANMRKTKGSKSKQNMEGNVCQKRSEKALAISAFVIEIKNKNSINTASAMFWGFFLAFE